MAKQSILLIDPHQRSISVMEPSLRKYGYEVKCATSPSWGRGDDSDLGVFYREARAQSITLRAGVLSSLSVHLALHKGLFKEGREADER